MLCIAYASKFSVGERHHGGTTTARRGRDRMQTDSVQDKLLGHFKWRKRRRNQKDRCKSMCGVICRHFRSHVDVRRCGLEILLVFTSKLPCARGTVGHLSLSSVQQ
jgi:hypothetical protein